MEIANIPWSNSIHHDGSLSFVSNPLPTFGEQVTIRLRASAEAPLQAVLLRTVPDGEQHLEPLRRMKTQDGYQWWEGALPINMPRVNYRFMLLTANGPFWYTQNGMQRATPTDAHDFRLLADFLAPTWLQSAVFYSIFPDRFADGDPTTNVKDNEYTYDGRRSKARPWGTIPKPWRQSGGVEFFGGDLQGITQKLDYLQALGVTALYLTPIFTAPSNHKYDSSTYHAVDPHFGGNAALSELRQALDQREMKLILDIAINHTGHHHEWFKRAQADLKSVEAEFYTFYQNDPQNYATWKGVRTLPKLNYRSHLLRETIYGEQAGVLRHWMRPPYRIDGWRLDVANMLARQGASQLGHKIGRAIRRAVKAENPAAYLIGENFFDYTAHLQGEELDASMNYQGFTIPLWHWLAGKGLGAGLSVGVDIDLTLSTPDLAAQWQQWRAAVPWVIARQQFNMLGSHDTARILTQLGGDIALAKLAATMLCTYPGVPCIYYGDEVGLEGGPDPDNRRCMPWDEATWNMDLHHHYQQLATLRRTSPALQQGGFQLLTAAQDTIAFLRGAPQESLIVVGHREGSARPATPLPVAHAGVPDGQEFTELFSGTTRRIEGGHLPLPALSAGSQMIWRATTS